MPTMIWVEPVIKPDFTLVCSNSMILHKADIPQDGEGYLFYDSSDTYSVTSATAPGYTSNISISGTTNLASQIVFTRDNNYVRFGVRPKGITGLKVNDSSAVTYSDSDTTTDYYLVNTLISTNATVSADDYVTENVGNITEGMIIALKPTHLYRYEKTNDPTSAMYTGNTDTIAEAQPLYEEDGNFDGNFVDDINSGNFTIHHYKPYQCWFFDDGGESGRYGDRYIYTMGDPEIDGDVYDSNLGITEYKITAIAQDLSSITVYSREESPTTMTCTRDSADDIDEDRYSITYYLLSSYYRTKKSFGFSEYFGNITTNDIERFITAKPTSYVPTDTSGLETYSFRSYKINDSEETTSLYDLVGRKTKTLSKIEYVYNATLNYTSETSTITMATKASSTSTQYGYSKGSFGSSSNPLFRSAYWTMNSSGTFSPSTSYFSISNASSWTMRPTKLKWTININNGQHVFTKSVERDQVWQDLNDTFYLTSGTFTINIGLEQESNTLIV